MNTKWTIAALALTCALVPAAQAKTEKMIFPEVYVMAEMDSMWVMKSAQGSLMEIALGRLAVAKSANAGVVEFANMLISHHETSYGELRALAERKRMAFPSELNPDQLLIVDYFQNSASPDWAKDYVAFEIEDHKKCIAETRLEISDGRDANVKEQAAKLLPILESHLQMAQELYNRM
jgi:putative membrane protein